MLGNLRKPLTAPVIEPRPLHNQDGTLRALVGQMLMDLPVRNIPDQPPQLIEGAPINWPVPVLTLNMILNRLRDFLADTSATAKLVESGAVTEEHRNPNLLYWQARAEEDADRPEPDAE